MWSTTKNSRGFTLVELLIVVAIIGILVAIVLTILNPALRFRQSRDAVRQNDVQSILTAIRIHEVDNGALMTEIDNLQDYEVYMIVNGDRMNAGCDDLNTHCTTNVSHDTYCVDISDLLDDGLLGEMPISPNGEGTWDDGSANGENGTGYTMEKTPDDVIYIRACENEATSVEIEVAG